LSVDTLLLVLCLFLMSPRLTGLALHEWFGVALILPVLVHLLLSWRWIVTALKRAFVPTRRRDLVNLLVTETFVLIGVTWLCRDGLKVRL
jgi:hypothetical protein